jgi:hypothetical protein
MATRFVLPFASVGNGITPEDGALLTFFDTGTSNKRTTFSNQAGTTPNANPVKADLNGIFPDIFVIGIYKVTLTDKNNVQIWEADPVNAGTLGNDAWVVSASTPTQTSATTFTLVGDQTSTFQIGRAFKGDDTTTLFGIISASVFTSLTTVTVVLDTGVLSSSLVTVHTGLSSTEKEISAHTVRHNALSGLSINRAANEIFLEVSSILKWVPLASIDGATDISSLVNAGIVELAAAGGGAIVVPANDDAYFFSSSLVMALNVSIIGQGGTSSELKFDGVDGLDFADLTAGVGNIIVTGLNITSVNGKTSATGIIHSGTSDFNAELFGVSIYGNIIDGFLNGITFRTVRNFWIKDNWIRNINSGIILEGKNITGRIVDNIITRSAGGTGTEFGIRLTSFNYTTPSAGFKRPEGIRITGNDIFNVEMGVDLNDAIACTVSQNEILAQIVGVQYTTVSGNMNINDNYIQMNDALAEKGIFGAGLASEPTGRSVRIEGNHIICTNTTGCNGIQMNEVGNQNQIYADIISNSITGADGFDIVVFNGGEVNIEKNKCFSNLINSIKVQSTLSGKLINIDGNHCFGDIRAPFGNTQNAQILLGYTTGTFSTLVKGTTIISSPDTTATTTFASLRGADVDSGTADGSSAGKLIQSGQNFLTTVSINDIVTNTTDDSFAYVTAVDLDTQLSISPDIIVSGESYTIRDGSTIPRFQDEGATLSGFEIIPVIQSHNVNAVGNVTASADAISITITLETAPSGTVEIQWEVMSRQKYI